MNHFYGVLPRRLFLCFNQMTLDRAAKMRLCSSRFHCCLADSWAMHLNFYLKLTNDFVANASWWRWPYDCCWCHFENIKILWIDSLQSVLKIYLTYIWFRHQSFLFWFSEWAIAFDNKIEYGWFYYNFYFLLVFRLCTDWLEHCPRVIRLK